MKIYQTEQRASHVSLAGEIQSLAPRQDPDPMHVHGSRVFAIGARIAVGILYFACFVAAIAQSADKPRLGPQSTVTRLTPPPDRATVQAGHDFHGNALANIVAASMGLTWIATQSENAS